MRHIYLILIIVFSSCADNDKLKSLEKENTDLKKEIKQLKEQMPSYEFEAYAIPNKKELTVGDTLFASVGLVVL